ncbi:conserved hypothetical protein [Talaromyces stipitatus ATCC 10500]|uniref:AMP-activated protein kinase glycogen-binding domain-containing protein n=1 Tax=Talaromyces stipitatus (strain ATCC 10500 / CBS 375.48 / QM 6759 / NRRL 1006) TaxID=441959 RepID=B8LUQ7_TALSN|nr:uncharacterized protein TSTA_073040 [Talaromyces stipitatus ATCC 10500]EED23914.1 conserved hypothetical protein [Talaromyces stipitatus ATCC 10500]
MGSYVFRWPREATEVYVTGTFDDWGKTVRLEKNGDVFEKEVHLPTIDGKIQYKFVVDGSWVTDSDARQESDGHNNINNVLLPEDLKSAAKPNTEVDSLTGGNTAAAVMAGVVPEATTAQLAGEVPKENNASSVPGGFPETPATEAANELSVNPIPATNGIGNPVKLTPGEPVPDPSTLSGNTVESTVRTDKEGYEADASNPVFLNKEEQAKADPLSVPPVSTGGLIPESSLPMNPPETAETPGVTIQSVHPTSTTAALAAEVPLESQKNAEVASDVPKVVKESLTKAHEAPEAAANAEAVEEKAEVEKELQNKVGLADAPAVPASDVPEVVKESLEKAHQDPEAAASEAAVEEKKEVEQELQQKVHPTEQAGEPAPITSAATTATAPTVESTDVSPQTSPPATAAATSAPSTTTQTQPTVTTGVASGTTTAESKPVAGAPQDNSKEKKKKHRASGFFQKLKEKLK